MTSELLVTRSVRLSVHDILNEGYYTNEKREQIMKTLTKLSGLNVHRGGFSGKKIYAYFNDVNTANAASLAVAHITYCITKVRRGTFNVTHLVIDNSTTTSEDLK